MKKRAKPASAAASGSRLLVDDHTALCDAPDPPHLVERSHTTVPRLTTMAQHAAARPTP